MSDNSEVYSQIIYKEPLQEMLERNAIRVVENISENEEECNMILQLAIIRGYVDIVRFLLQHGANPNARDKDGHTVLMLAVMTGDIRIIKTILIYGADISITENQFALTYAIKRGYIRTADISRLYYETGGTNTAEEKTSLEEMSANLSCLGWRYFLLFYISYLI